MAYDKDLAQRINNAFAVINPPGLVSKNMFGGIGYMVQGNMACGILDDKLIVRVGREAYEKTLARPGVGLFNSRGRAMTGWVMVQKDVLQDEQSLLDWVQLGVTFSLTLPPK